MCGKGQVNFYFCFNAFMLKLKRKKTISDLLKKLVQQKWFCFGMFCAFSGQDYSSFLFALILLSMMSSPCCKWMGYWRMQSPRRSACLTVCDWQIAAWGPRQTFLKPEQTATWMSAIQFISTRISLTAILRQPLLCLLTCVSSPQLKSRTQFDNTHIFISSMREKSYLTWVLNYTQTWMCP